MLGVLTECCDYKPENDYFKVFMIITTKNGQTFDTNRDLTAAERHILQKLFLWESMASSVQEFREKKKEALLKGWNNSGPVKQGGALQKIVRHLETKVSLRLKKF